MNRCRLTSGGGAALFLTIYLYSVWPSINSFFPHIKCVNFITKNKYCITGVAQLNPTFVFNSIIQNYCYFFRNGYRA